jgi:hypothetical protein
MAAPRRAAHLIDHDAPIGTERELPRPSGMMQKVQRWSQPFCTCTKARGWPSAMPSMRCGGVFAHRHDVADCDLLGSSCALAARRPRGLPHPPGSRRQLLGIAEHAIDLRHAGEAHRARSARRSRSRRCGRSGFSREPADRLAGLAHRLAVTAQVLIDDTHRKAGSLAPRARSPRLSNDVEPAAEGDELDRHQAG